MAAQESGLCVHLDPEGGMEFTHEPRNGQRGRKTAKLTPEEALQRWLDGEHGGNPRGAA